MERRNIRLLLLIVPIILACGWVATPTPAVGAPITYDFTLIADTTGPYSGFSRTPTINNGGTVAFQAGLDVGGIAVLTGAGGPTTTIVDSAGGVYSTFSLGATPVINDSGTVAFFGTLLTGERGMFTGVGGPITTIVLQGGVFGSGFGFTPSMNNAGTVAFTDTLTAGGQGVFTGTGGPITTISTTTGTGLSNPAINDTGTVAFWFGTSLPLTQGIFTGTGGPITTIAKTGPGSPQFFLIGDSPAINDAGTVAFSATIAGAVGVFTGAGGPTTPIANTTGPFNASFPSLIHSSINDAGNVAFQIGLDADGSGIFTGPDILNDTVIRTGDLLFGSTVTDLGFFRDGLNNDGALAFWAKLSDGREVIVRATPETAVPEPATLILLGSGLIGLAGYGRKKFFKK